MAELCALFGSFACVLVPLILSLILCGFLGSVIASGKDAAVFGFVLGFLLGPIGILIAVFVDNRPRCPKCRERISRGASMCPHCRTDFAAEEEHELAQEFADDIERAKLRAERQAIVAQKRAEQAEKRTEQAKTTRQAIQRVVQRTSERTDGFLHRLAGDDRFMLWFFRIVLLVLVTAAFAMVIYFGYPVVRDAANQLLDDSTEAQVPAAPTQSEHVAEPATKQKVATPRTPEREAEEPAPEAPSRRPQPAMEPQAKPESDNAKYIPGLTAVDVHGNLTNKGFTLKRDYHSALEVDGVQYPSGMTWFCEKSTAEYQIAVMIDGEGPEKITYFSATYSKFSAENVDDAAREFMGFMASIPYEGAQPSVARQWVESNIGNHLATRTIGGVVFLIVANPEIRGTRILRIQPESTMDRFLLTPPDETPSAPEASATPPDPEKRAKQRLDVAKSLLKQNPAAGKRWLRRLIDEYPGTEAAAEAQRLLDE